MAETWRDKLLPASFRNVAFLIEDTSVPVGRKVQLHEYPKRDEAYAEQMGKVARVHKVKAFVIGKDCFDQRDSLLKALETEGAGTLVHPWLGQISVVPGPAEMAHSRREGGMVTFDLTFYPGNAQINLGARANTAKQVAQTSASYWSSALDRYKSAMAVVDTARINVAGLQNKLSGVFNVVTSQFSPLTSTVGGVSALAHSLINSPSSLSSMFTSYFSDISSFSSVFGSSGGSSGGGAAATTFSSYSGAVAGTSQQAEAAVAINTVDASSGVDTTAAAQALANLVQDAVLVQATATVAEMPVAAAPAVTETVASVDQQVIAPVERDDVPVANEVIAARDALDEAFWQAALKADASYYPSINAARQLVVKHLTAVAASGMQIVEVTPPETTSALVLAYRRFGDATRQGEIVQRNKIRHPGFVPAAPIQIARE